MYIIKGNARKINHVWEHIKRHHTGEKIAVVGFPNKLPENYLRNKQVIFYESLTHKDEWLIQAEKFLTNFEEEYDGVIFYIDCTLKEAENLKKVATKFRSLITVTVASDSLITIEEYLLSQQVA